MNVSDDAIQYDVVIVGAGPAGLSCAIALKQQAPSMSVCLLEKGQAVGSHILSGAILEPHALNRLLPKWKERYPNIATPVTDETFCFLGAKRQITVPHWLLPPEFSNKGNDIISLGILCRHLGEHATELGVDIFTGTTAAQYTVEDQRVVGITTGPMGLDADGNPTAQYTPGFDIRAPFTLLAEGARGYLSEKIIRHFKLRPPDCIPTYGLGIKELWECPNDYHQTGRMMHCAGWPLPHRTYGGGFIYHYANQKIGIGLVVALDYSDPLLDPYACFSQFKTHPCIAPLFKGARCLSYGARVINEGGLSGLPQLHFPGGALIGCAAGLLNVAKIKGIHNALQSGQLAAQAIVSAPQAGDLSHYSTLIKQSCVYDELHRSRNVRHYFQHGLSLGTLLTGLDLKLFRGRTPWTLKNKQTDRSRLKATSCIKHSSNALPDFCHSRQDALYFANLHSRENQPNHLHIASLHHFMEHNTPYHHPETRYCPARVYEYPNTGTEKKLTINASNCLHCKACDIKDPSHQIHWQLPEGGSGPNYTEM